MKSIQSQYRDLVEGRMSKANFMRNVRMQFPQHISPTTSFNDSVKILKGKRILSEAKKPEGVYGHNPNAEADTYRGIDHLNYYQVYHGLQYELANMSEITDENYIKARKKVVEKILKDPDAYKNLQLANFKAVKQMDEDLEMKEVKKDNRTDKANGMKVVEKDVKGNTQDSLGKKEAKKSKNGKGIQHMTQTPKGKLEAFATPGKEKVLALKEHILDEMTTTNPHHEELHRGMEVYRKKGDATPGQVIEYDGHTATVQWEDGTTEDLQKNVLTKQKPVKQVEKEAAPVSQDPYGEDPNLDITDDGDEHPAGFPGMTETDKTEKLKSLKEKLVKALGKEGYAVTTKSGTPLALGKDTAQGIVKAREFERSTGDQLSVLDTRTGKKTDA